MAGHHRSSLESTRPTARRPRRPLRRIGVAVGSVLAALGAIAGILSLVFDHRTSTEAGVAIMRHSLTNTTDVAQEAQHVVEGTTSRTTANTTAIDVVLENSHDQPGVVTELELVVKNRDRLRTCTGAGPISIETQYDFRVPDDFDGTSIRKPVLHQIPAHDQERLLVTVGPENEAPNSWGTIFTVDLVLKEESGKRHALRDLTIMPSWQDDRTIASVVSSEHGNGWSQSPSCLRGNMRTLDNALDRPGEHSPAIAELRDRLRAAGAAGDVPGVWVVALGSPPGQAPTAQRQLADELDAPVNQLSTEDGTLLYHPGPFPDAQRALQWCRQHGLPAPELCRPRYLDDGD
ncbi:hypothetical protein [Bounagaea algeriensis]